MPDFEREQIGVAVILAQACARIRSAFERRQVHYPFPVLCDPDRVVIKRYGVWYPWGFDGFNTAHPASFLIDAAGCIRYAFVGSTQFARTPVAHVLDVAAHVSGA
jgi:peroxiredoxin